MMTLRHSEKARPISSPRQTGIKKILVVGNRLLGDSIDSLSASFSLLRHFANREAHLLTYSYSKPLYEEVAAFKKIFLIDSKKNYHYGKPKKLRFNHYDHYEPRWRWREYLNNFRQLRQERYDLIFLLPGGFGFGLLAFLLGIPYRVGHCGDFRRLLLTHSLPSKKTIPNYENFNRLLNCFEGIKKKTYLLPTAEQKLSLPQRYFVISPCASEESREWDGKNFAALAQRVEKQYDAKAVFIGLAEEKERIQAWRGAIGENWAGKLNLKEVFAVLRGALFFLGNDSGIAHAAGLLGVNTLILLGPSNPTLARPLGSRVELLFHEVAGVSHAARKKKRYRSLVSMQHLTVERVLERVFALLSNGAAKNWDE